MVMVTRLTRQKGMDLVTYALDRILSGGVQVAVLGTGDTDYENALRYFEGKYPGTMAARIQFDPALSQRMYAGADLFLMPSLFEPCGLSQMIAMRYGTLPIVRETGGLKDTVAPYNQFTGEGTGFSFANFNGDEMADTVFRAARLFWDDRGAFDKLVDNAMAADFSWTRSADVYMAMYHNLRPDIPLPQHETDVAPTEETKPAKEAKPAETEVKLVDEPAATTVNKPAARKTTTRKTTTAKVSAAKSTTAKSAATKAKTTAAPAAKPAAKKPAASKTAAKTSKASAVAPKTATSAPVPAAKPATANPAQAKIDLDAVLPTIDPKPAATPAADPKPATPAAKVVPKATRRGKRK